MSKKKRKVKKGPQNPLAGKPVDKLLDVLIAEGFKEDVDPALEALQEKKSEAAEEIMKRIKGKEEADQLTIYSEALAALCKDEENTKNILKKWKRRIPKRQASCWQVFGGFPRLRNLSGFGIGLIRL